MEKIAIISDIHGNITALEAVLADIKARGIEKIFCLGDLVLKCANPDLVIDRIKDTCEVVLKGNCDEAVASENAYNKKFWSRVRIGEERAEYLKQLPVSYDFYMSGHLIRLFHASPNSLFEICNPIYSNQTKVYPEIYNFDFLFKNTEFIGKNENDIEPDIIGYGHIHTQNLFRYKNKLLFNPGSVGFPNEMLNDGNEEDKTNNFSTLASYSIIEGEYDSKDLSSITISAVRVPYDLQKEVDYLEQSDMPNKEKMIYSLKTASSNYK